MKAKKKPAPIPDRLRGLDPREIQAHVADVESTSEAQAIPLPGPLGAAFAGAGRKVCGLLVRAPVAIDFALLQRIDSPLIRQMAEMNKPKSLQKETPFTDQDGYNMVFQFTHPPEQTEMLLADGRKYFEGRAKAEVAHKMNPFAVATIIETIGALMTESFTTFIRHCDDSGGGDEGKKTKVFPVPPSETRTGSDGGSTTSAHSSPATHK